MYNPDKYIKVNIMQRNDANDILNKFIKEMTWKSNEIVLDIGCGPGDVTQDIIYPSIKNNIQQLVGVDISKEMIEYAKKSYCFKIDFEVLDIENDVDWVSYKNRFSKIFSFFCLNLVYNKTTAAKNIYSMLKRDGEILIHFLLIPPVFETYQYMDEEWETYIQDVSKNTNFLCKREEIEDIFIKVGFKIIKTESDIHSFTFPSLEFLLSAFKAVDSMYYVLSKHLHDKYFLHFKDTMKKKLVTVCPTTGNATIKYTPIIIHAIKN